MSYSQIAGVIVHNKGLNIFSGIGGTCRGISVVPNGSISCKLGLPFVEIIKHLGDQPLALNDSKNIFTVLPIMCNHARGFLASVLESVKAIVRHHSGIFMVGYSKNSAKTFGSAYSYFHRSIIY
jgi:hypothetical protein